MASHRTLQPGGIRRPRPDQGKSAAGPPPCGDGPV